MSHAALTQNNTQSTMARRSNAPGLEDFFAAVRETNPFAANRITEPSLHDVDVPEIHAAAFDRLTGLACQALDIRTGIGVSLLGGAGVGKSHLLSRLYRWANEPTESGGPRACYVYLHNILADPDRLPRYLLKYVISRLTEGSQGPLHQTPLYRFVERAIRQGIKVKGAKADDAKAVHRAYQDYFASYPEGKGAFEVLYQFLRHGRLDKASDPSRRYLASQAIAWLSGDEIDAETARTLGLKANDQEAVMLRDDQEIKQILIALAQLARLSRQPLVLCIDQVENLDPDKLKPLCRFLHAVLDHTANLTARTARGQTDLEVFVEKLLNRSDPEATLTPRLPDPEATRGYRIGLTPRLPCAEKDLWVGWVEPICGEDWKCQVGSAARPVELPAGRHYWGVCRSSARGTSACARMSSRPTLAEVGRNGRLLRPKSLAWT